MRRRRRIILQRLTALIFLRNWKLEIKKEMAEIFDYAKFSAILNAGDGT